MYPMGNSANNGESSTNTSAFITLSMQKLLTISNTQIKTANHWLKLKGLFEQQKYITASREERAVIKLQAWWRGSLYRANMNQEHKERLARCVEEIREEPCSEANPKDERKVPLNRRVESYIDGLLSLVLTERKVMAIRLNRLANRSHVCIECMLSRNVFGAIIECMKDLNRSEAHLFVLRPLCELLVKTLSYQPFVNAFAQENLDGLLSLSVLMIHHNYKDRDVVSQLATVLSLLATFAGFKEKMKALNYGWYMRKFHQLFGRLKPNDPRFAAYKKLCRFAKECSVNDWSEN